MATEVLDREKLINEIWHSRGKVGVISERLGVSARTIYYYAEKYVTVKNALEDARLQFDEIMLDLAENSLVKSVKDGDSWAVKYVLSTKGKNRGYVERQEVTGPDGGPMQALIILPAKDMDGDD